MNLTENQRQLFLAISLRMSNVVLAEKVKATKKNKKSTGNLIAG